MSAVVNTSPPPALRRSLGKRVVLWLLSILVCLLVVAAAGFYWLASSALPQLDGTVQVKGLSRQVTVTRDSHGVPAIEAANLEDLFFAQGYVTAQDRLWQMDILRRFAAGELAEILGKGLVRNDREQRILGMRVAAEKTVAIASPEERLRFEAYARGVNAYIDSHRSRLPLEFRILRYSPRPWTPLDSALIGAQMVKDLNHGTFKAALTREKILARLGPELTADLYVNTSSHDRVPTVNKLLTPARHTNEGDLPETGDSVAQSWTSSTIEEEGRFLVGSNNWVVSGAHTVTGKALLSNDMHLGHQMPNLWYEAHLHCGDFDVAGVTLPGMPYVIVGHNRRIAWGFTNVGPTVEDIYVETFADNGKYLTPDGWKEPQQRRETIQVKGAAPAIVDVRLTRHGPIIRELVPGETRELALRWVLYDGMHIPFFAVDSAQNWEQFRQAFSQLDAPGQNVVYADVAGNIGYQATGRIPIRADGDGSLPVSGSDNRHEWTGYIPFDKLPSSYNPASGILATANSRITPDKYSYSISTEWEAPWRTERIYRILESGKKLSSDDMLALQNDIYSEIDKYIAEKVVEAVDHAKNATPRAKRAAEIMRGWDGRMSANSPAPTLANQSRSALASLLLESKGIGGLNYHWSMQSVWLENVVRDQPKRWLPEKYSNYSELLLAALERCVSNPAVPKDLATWNWGAFNAIEIQNPVLGQIPLLSRWTGTGVHPQSGSGAAVRAVTTTHGPSERMTVDLANLDESRLNVVTGQSGNFLSPHYLDQWKAWYEGQTFKLPFTEDAIQAHATQRLTLTP